MRSRVNSVLDLHFSSSTGHFHCHALFIVLAGCTVLHGEYPLQKPGFQGDFSDSGAFSAEMAPRESEKSKSGSDEEMKGDKRDKDEDYDTEVIKIEDADAAFVLGRGGATKTKIAKVSGARLDLDEQNHTLEIAGTKDARHRARDYTKCARPHLFTALHSFRLCMDQRCRCAASCWPSGWAKCTSA